MLTVRRYNDADEEHILAFHREFFGDNSYQATSAYLQWLYQDNPFQESEPPCFILHGNDDTIVGCIHSMALSAVSPTKTYRVRSLQNLVVDTAYRGGAGMILVKRALKDADVVIFPGVGGVLANAYRAMKYREINSFWTRKLLRPVRAAVGVLRSKLGKERRRFRLHPHCPALSAQAGLTIETRPGEETLERIAALLAERDYLSGNLPVLWTSSALRWRFFSINGPVHLLFMSKLSGEFSIFSIGMRRNVCVARPIEIGPVCSVSFLESSFNCLRMMGVEMLLAYTGRVLEQNMYSRLGFSEVTQRSSSFVITGKGCDLGFSTVTPGATDLGFEGFKTQLAV
jgi:hypothetical protein